MSRKGAETQRDAHWFALTRWVNACLLASASSSRLCAFARHPIAGFRIIGYQPERPDSFRFLPFGFGGCETGFTADFPSPHAHPGFFAGKSSAFTMLTGRRR